MHHEFFENPKNHPHIPFNPLISFVTPFTQANAGANDMAKKCYWCADKDRELSSSEFEFRGKKEAVEICSEQCEKDLLDFVAYASDHLWHFLIGLFALPLIGTVITILMQDVDNGGFGCFVIFAGMGGVIFKYPFVTPQTVAMFGAKKGIAIGRYTGIGCIVLGVGFWIVLSIWG